LSKVELEFEQMSSELEASRIELSERDESICRLQTLLETEKSRLEDRIYDLERAKELLLDSKVELQNEVEKSAESCLQMRKQVEVADARSHEVKTKLEGQIQDLKYKLVSHLHKSFRNFRERQQ
jgi:predicted  nucleic acid-binding Zn-ribbon protein